MNTNSIALISIVIICCASIIPLRIWGKKIYSHYLFWIIPNILFFSYFIIFRFIEDWISFSEILLNNNHLNAGNFYYSITYSKALLLDLCPFIALVLPILLTVFRKRNIANVIAPFAIFGGFITLFGGVLFDDNARFNIEYIFFGYKNNEIYFFMHSYLLIYGVLVLATCENNKFIYILWSHIFALLYFLYILTLSKLLKVNWNVTGIVGNDWLPGGQYHIISNILKLKFPYILLVSFLLAYLFINLNILGNIFINKKIIKKYPNHFHQLF